MKVSIKCDKLLLSYTKEKKFNCIGGNMFRKKGKLDKEKLELNNEIQFYNLSPNEVDEGSIYLKALDYAIKDKNVSNIAVTENTVLEKLDS